MIEKEERLPSLNSLRVFEVAARYMSFTQAAKELHVTQSAISHRIKTLEEELGMRLFKRENTKLVLTEEGEKLLPELSKVFVQIRSAISSIKSSSKKESLIIVLRPYFSQEWLLPRLPDFWAAYPEIDLHLVHSIQTPALNSMDYDLSIQWLDTVNDGLEAIKLLDGNLTACCNPKLLQSNDFSVEDIVNYPLLDEESPDNWNMWLSLAGIDYTKVKKRLSVDDTNVRMQAALDGTGFILTCLSLLNQRLSKENSLVAPFPDIKLYNYNYYLTYPKNTILKKQARIFIDWLKKQIE